MAELKYILFIVGTWSFMATNQTIVKDCVELEEVVCNKDTVKKRCLQKWSRGIFIIATAGGHIEYWQPLYKLVMTYCIPKISAISKLKVTIFD